ncbi:hypothetical protein SEA_PENGUINLOVER67_60 [Mycobacterium phage PenguinLover67]|nr:hypothetical protein SEA_PENGUINLOVER67_60 [Mycobacterium phage PenguinLover67]
MRTLIATAVACAGLALIPSASADEPHPGTGARPGPATINLSEFGNIDAIPVCAVEDCSDQPAQVGLWRDRDTGNWWFSTGPETSWLIVDDTAASA